MNLTLTELISLINNTNVCKPNEETNFKLIKQRKQEDQMIIVVKDCRFRINRIIIYKTKTI